MDTRAPQGFVPIVAAVEPKAKRGSAATDLPKPKAVEPSAEAPRSNNERIAEDEARRARQEASAEALRAQSELDVKTHEATGSLVIQTLAGDTGELRHQFPNNATLKQRAIARYDALQGVSEIRRTV
ncbi:MAG: hypothetical protein ACE37E_03130 [Hyphomicrobiales bacterium]|jgi:hypothetical protein